MHKTRGAWALDERAGRLDTLRARRRDLAKAAGACGGASAAGAAASATMMAAAAAATAASAVCVLYTLARACRFSLLGCAGGGVLVIRTVRVRRTAELNALTGWRARLCTLMEAADVAAPLVSAALERLSRALSWLLVALIGRGLGLVARGIRQSMAPSEGGGSGRRRRRPGGPKRGSASTGSNAERSGGDEPFFYGFS